MISQRANNAGFKTTRRAVLLGGTFALAAPGLLRAQGMMEHGGLMESGRNSTAATPAGGAPFRSLPTLNVTDGKLNLRAMAGQTRFEGGAPTKTKGFGQAYLGPTIRLMRGQTIEAQVANATERPISVHWHGLHVTSDADGGAPQSAIATGNSWRATLPIEQPAATLWYHTHVHGHTAPDVWAGLAGAIILQDEVSDALGLPSTDGIDDFTIIMQDKSFDAEGRANYDPGMMGIMHGVVGQIVLVNGQFAPRASVPAGPVRLRLINAATSAEHHVTFAHPTIVVGVDQGLLPEPIAVESVTVSPGARVEVIVDLSDGEICMPSVTAATVGSSKGGDASMMGGGMMAERSTPHPLLTLAPDASLPVRGRIPDRLVDPLPDTPTPVTTRRFVLQENMGPMQHLRSAIGSGPVMAINGEPYNPDRMDFTVKRGTVERWTISAEGMAHPFHAHGVKFRVPEPNGPEEMGWKDVVTVAGTRDLWVSVEAESRSDIPFMYHCHILEHEDAGMMGQFITK